MNVLAVGGPLGFFNVHMLNFNGLSTIKQIAVD
jgi:hypothetical protein